MERKPIQIAIDGKCGILVLCNDSTMWVMPFASDAKWIELVDIPQPLREPNINRNP